MQGETVEIRAAGQLLGKPPNDTEALIRSEVDCPGAWVASIGRAGENLVRFATISNEGRHAGRGGVGAVMGSKNLKAIALYGDRETTVAHPQELEAIAASLRRRSLSSVTDKYRHHRNRRQPGGLQSPGHPADPQLQQSTFEDADAVSGEALTENHFSRRHGCASCTIRCERLFKSQGGDGEQRLEYETLFALGPLCGISDPELVLEAARLCDRYGLDTISTGGTLAWAMEAARKACCQRRNTRLALRPWRAVSGGDSRDRGARRPGCAAGRRLQARRARDRQRQLFDWAMHVKGLELPGYEPRSLKTMALGLAVSPRGACHNRSGAYEADFSGEVDRFQGDAGRGALVAASEDFAAVLDSMIVCKFLRKCFTDFYAEAARILQR